MTFQGTRSDDKESQTNSEKNNEQYRSVNRAQNRRSNVFPVEIHIGNQIVKSVLKLESINGQTAIGTVVTSQRIGMMRPNWIISRTVHSTPGAASEIFRRQICVIKNEID